MATTYLDFFAIFCFWSSSDDDEILSWEKGWNDMASGHECGWQSQKLKRVQSKTFLYGFGRCTCAHSFNLIQPLVTFESILHSSVFRVPKIRRMYSSKFYNFVWDFSCAEWKNKKKRVTHWTRYFIKQQCVTTFHTILWKLYENRKSHSWRAGYIYICISIHHIVIWINIDAHITHVREILPKI